MTLKDLSDVEVPVMIELWGMRRIPSLPSVPGLIWPEVVPPDKVLSMAQIKLYCVLMLNWIVWNRTVLTFNCMWTKTILILNWIVWNGTVWLKWIACNRNDLIIKLCAYI